MSGEDVRKTLRAYQQAVTREPTNVELRQRLAGYLSKLGHTRQAVQELELCAKLLAARGELIQAISVGKRLLKLDPERTDILLFLTRHFAGHADLPHFQRVAAVIEPHDPDRTPPEPVSAVTEGGATTSAVREVTSAAPDPREVSTRVVRLPERDERLESIELTVVSLGEEDDVPGPLETEDSRVVDVLLDTPIPVPRDAHAEPPKVVRIEVPNTRPLDIDAEALPTIPLFSSLGAGPFAELLDSLEHRVLEPGAEICGTTERFGDPGLKILVQGSVAARFHREDGEVIELGPVLPGSFVGEAEVLTGDTRHHVSLIAETEAEFLVVPHERLVELWTTWPEIRRRLESLHHKRLVRDFLAASTIFDSLSVTDRELLARRLRPRTLRPGEVLGRPGEATEGLYLVREGELRAEHPDGGEVRIAPGTFFGIHSLNDDGRFVSTLTAIARCTLLVLRRPDLAQVLASYPLAVEALDALAAEALEFGSAE